MYGKLSASLSLPSSRSPLCDNSALSVWLSRRRKHQRHHFCRRAGFVQKDHDSLLFRPPLMPLDQAAMRQSFPSQLDATATPRGLCLTAFASRRTFMSSFRRADQKLTERFVVLYLNLPGGARRTNHSGCNRIPAACASTRVHRSKLGQDG